MHKVFSVFSIIVSIFLMIGLLAGLTALGFSNSPEAAETALNLIRGTGKVFSILLIISSVPSFIFGILSKENTEPEIRLFIKSICSIVLGLILAWATFFI